MPMPNRDSKASWRRARHLQRLLDLGKDEGQDAEYEALIEELHRDTLNGLYGMLQGKKA